MAEEKEKKSELSWDEIGKAVGAKIEKEWKKGDMPWDKACVCRTKHVDGCGGAFYGLGFIGAAVYYISTATGFWMGVLGVLKAILWPAFLVHGALKFLGL